MSAPIGLWDRGTIARRAAQTLVETTFQLGHGRRVLTLRDTGAAPSLLVWHGPPGRGKTCAGELLCRQALDAAAGQAAMVSATFTRVPDVATALRGLLRLGVGVFPERAYRSRSAAELASLILDALASSQVNILVVDEAGALGPYGLEAVATLVDRAAERGMSLHVVLIGMQELPGLLHRNPRVLSRVSEVTAFEPMAREDFGRVMRAHADALLTVLDRTVGTPELVDATIHALADGSLRDAVQLLGRANVYHLEAKLPFDLSLLQLCADLHAEAVGGLLRPAIAGAAPTRPARSRSFPRPA